MSCNLEQQTITLKYCLIDLWILQGAIAERIRESIYAGFLRSPPSGFTKADIRALINVLSICGIRLDLKTRSASETLESGANLVDEQAFALCTEAITLENCLQSLQETDEVGVSKLLKDLQIKNLSPLYESIARLPQALADVVDVVGENQIELQFPLTHLTELQRIAMGAGMSQSLIVRLVLDFGDLPPGFCVRFSSEIDHNISNDHSPWLMLQGCREPDVQYCYGHLIRGTFQLSYALWRYLRKENFSIEGLYTSLASTIDNATRNCIVCGSDLQVELHCAGPCTEKTCFTKFNKVSQHMRLTGVAQDPSVMDLLLTSVHASTTADTTYLLTLCPNKQVGAMQTFFDVLRPVTAETVMEAMTQTSHIALSFSESLRKDMTPILNWVCSGYGGFLVSATGPFHISALANSQQFLLANASPQLEKGFDKNFRAARSKSRILFHGTSLDRLYPILPEGLRICSGTPLQRYGAAFGPGIYMAEEPSLAFRYARPCSSPVWKSSALGAVNVLLACELAGSVTPRTQGFTSYQIRADWLSDTFFCCKQVLAFLSLLT